MLVFDISDFTQNATKVFDAALTDEVIINNKNGKSYKIPLYFLITLIICLFMIRK
jgi:hypothetical protein